MNNWIESEAIAMASHKCTQCHGLGTMKGRGTQTAACNCVLRAIFRACYARFRESVEQERHLSQARLERLGGGRSNRQTWGRKSEEYIADFTLVTKRVLTPAEYKLFNFHFLLGADWKLCCRQLKMERGHFFHAVYRIEQKLGRVYRELQPYSLFPLDEYFYGSTRDEERSVQGRLTEAERQQPVPIRKAARTLPFSVPRAA